MANEILIFDAAASNPDGTDPGTPLEIGPGDDLRLREFSVPAPPQTVQYAGSVDTEGSLIAGRKHENRVIGMSILCTTAASLRSLQAKIGKVAREGGTLKWIQPNAEVVTFDLLTADTLAPAINKLFYVRTGAFVEVQVSLVAKPYGRGTEVALSASSAATANQPLVFTKTGIKGDWFGVGKLRITNASNDKSHAVWGIQSRYYSSASSAALFLEAESATAINAVADAGPSGASGGGANKTMLHSNVGTSLAASFALENLSHVGTFRVFTRVQVPSTGGAGTVSVAKFHSVDGSSIGPIDDPVDVTDHTGSTAAVHDTWVILDLGTLTIPPPVLGTNAWMLRLLAQSTTSTDDIYYDWVALVPADEGYGMAYHGVNGSEGPLVTSSEHLDVTDRGVFPTDGTSYRRAQVYEGDYLRVPPAGPESRTLRVFAMLAGAEDSSVWQATAGSFDGTNLDAITATLTYVPRYLVVSEP